MGTSLLYERVRGLILAYVWRVDTDDEIQVP